MEYLLLLLLAVFRVVRSECQIKEVGQAVLENRPDDIAGLVERGCDFNNTYEDQWPIILAAQNNLTDVVWELLQIPGLHFDVEDRAYRTALFYAAQNGYVEIVELLGEAGADLNRQDQHGTIILFAPYSRLYYKNPTLARKTFKSISYLGADLDRNWTVGHGYDELMYNPLIYMTYFGDYAAIKFLLCAGVDRHFVNKGLTALQWAKTQIDTDTPLNELPEIIALLENPPKALECECDHLKDLNAMLEYPKTSLDCEENSGESKLDVSSWWTTALTIIGTTLGAGVVIGSALAIFWRIRRNRMELHSQQGTEEANQATSSV